MVSRGIGISNILKGIHQSMAGRYLRLLTAARAKGVVLVTGGLAADVGLDGPEADLAAGVMRTSPKKAGCARRQRNS